jgi:putative transposase
VTAFRFIHAENAKHPIATMCNVLGVSRSGYYRWRSAKPSKRKREDQLLAAKVRTIYKEHKGRYGRPRICRELRDQGHRVGPNRVARLMHSQGLRGRIPRRFRRTTDSRGSKRIAPNILDRDFTAAKPNHAWVGDVTYVPTREGWLYLAVLVDLFLRRVVGWAMSDTINTKLVLGALHMAVANRNPATGLIHHTDRDCRYASDEYRNALNGLGFTASMSRKGNCWDNAVSESFFATLEKELLDNESFLTWYHGRVAIAEYIEKYYNDRRRHSYLDYVSPIEYEVRAAIA